MPHLFRSLWVLCGLATGAAAGSDPSALCDQAAIAAARSFGVPEKVMRAITRVETGQQRGGLLRPWPWAVNETGTGHWFDTASEARDFVETELATGQQNMDIGCFQLNLRWHAAGFSSLEEMFAPQTNANYAAGFLTDLFETEGNWVDAVAAYHSRTPEHAEAYIEKVEDVLIGLADPLGATDPVTEPRANRFPLLQPGGSTSNGSIFASGAKAQPLFGGGS